MAVQEEQLSEVLVLEHMEVDMEVLDMDRRDLMEELDPQEPMEELMVDLTTLQLEDMSETVTNNNMPTFTQPIP
jgi:hypothetical protein